MIFGGEEIESLVKHELIDEMAESVSEVFEHDLTKTSKSLICRVFR